MVSLVPREHFFKVLTVLRTEDGISKGRVTQLNFSVRQSVAAMEAVQSEAPAAEPAEVVEEPAQEEPAWNYQVGDKVYLDDTAFLVEQITDREVQLRDPTLVYPIFRAEIRDNFEKMLSQDERNHAVRVDAQAEEKPVTEEFLSETEPRDYTPEYSQSIRRRSNS